tara:strand:+ start:274 stop:1599 length:1326 start_codon:yes stop_codon:yes gene_type:complete
MALIVLIFILLANFLLRTMDKFLGKGIDTSLLLEYVFLNLAWVLALAVPMAVLISTLMAYGRLSEDNEITAIRTSGISNFKLIKPALYFGIFITFAMCVFNNIALPEMNHKARLLSRDISRKRPDLEFEAGYFINTIPGYTFFLESRLNDVFYGITIYSKKTSNKIQQTITANSGTIENTGDGIILHLINGNIHELNNSTNEYRQINYSKYDVFIPIDNLSIQRRNSKIRGDREMTYSMINKKIDNYNIKIDEIHSRIKKRLKNELNIESNKNELDLNNIENKIKTYESNILLGLNESDKKLYVKEKRKLKNLRKGIQTDFNLISNYKKYINKYLVELHKKFSIPFASLIFILVGAPLGILSKKGGFAMSVTTSLGFFVIYWGFLIGGEEFADRGLISPFLAMWQPNFFIGIIGLFFLLYMSSEKNILYLLKKIFNSRNAN